MAASLEQDPHTTPPPPATEAAAVDPWVLRCAPALGAGRHPVLDLACGSGRHARWLARLGRRVVGVDRDPERIDRAAALGTCGGAVEYRLAEVAPGRVPPGPWGGICVVRFLDRALFPELAAALVPGGWLLVATHLDHPARDPARRPRNPAYRLRPGELLTAFPELVTLAWEERCGGGAAWAGLLARRPATPPGTPPPG